MTSPIGLIRDGIANGDWKKVADGYAAMTGERLSPPPQDASLLKFLGDFIARGTVLLGGAGPAAGPSYEDHWGGAEPVSVKEARESREQEKAQSEEAEVVAARARELRDERHGIAPKTVPAAETDPLAQFRVEHKGPKSETGDRVCKTLPFEKPTTNKFKDDPSLVPEEIEESKAMSQKKTPEPRRPAVKKVDVVCCKCQGEFKVPPVLAPKGMDKDGEPNLYVCNGCVGSAKEVKEFKAPRS